MEKNLLGGGGASTLTLGHQIIKRAGVALGQICQPKWLDHQRVNINNYLVFGLDMQSVITVPSLDSII